MQAKVVVITGPGHPTLLESKYAVRYIAAYWRPLGVEFAMTTDPKTAPEGDIGWQHLDVTRVPTAYTRLLARYPVTINGGTRDVGKDVIASHLVSRDDEWQGAVIVKTNLNFGGRVEDWAKQWRPLRHPWFHRLRDQLPSRMTGRMAPEKYPILESKAEVPGWMWNDRRFVVQRFLAERRGELYGIRRWFFLGSSEFAYRAFGAQPIVQGDTHAEWERVEPPAAARAYRERLGLDYGKIDYAELDGEFVAYDVNPAVSADGPVGSEIQRELVAAITPGLGEWLARVRRG